jgi:UDP-3-O-[3-hydroxymyristoyl] glucosamine N-acyltransferase
MTSLNQYHQESKSKFEVRISELITHELLSIKFEQSFKNASCFGFSTVDSKIDNSITFAKNERFLLQAIKNENIKFVLTPKNTKALQPDSEKIVEVDDPEIIFHKLRKQYFDLKSSLFKMPNTFIGINTKIKNFEMIPEKGVYIGSNCEIDASIISSGCLIGENVRIFDQADIGCDDLMVIRGPESSSRHIMHDDQLIINDDSIVYSGAKVAKGVYGTDTIIGPECNIGLNCVIGHGVKIGRNTTVCSNSSVGGFTEVGESSYLGLSSVLKNRISIKKNTKVAAGSVVLKSFNVDNITIIGNPGKRFNING